MTDETVTPEDFFAKLEAQSWGAKVWWSLWGKTSRSISRVRRAPRRLQFALQRVRRGWSEQDAWTFDHFLSGVIAGGTRQLARNMHGYPVDVDPDEWFEILTKISKGFALRKTDWDWDLRGKPKELAEAKAQIDEAMQLFAKFYGSLWD